MSGGCFLGYFGNTQAKTSLSFQDRDLPPLMKLFASKQQMGTWKDGKRPTAIPVIRACITQGNPRYCPTKAVKKKHQYQTLPEVDNQVQLEPQQGLDLHSVSSALWLLFFFNTKDLKECFSPQQIRSCVARGDKKCCHIMLLSSPVRHAHFWWYLVLSWLSTA